ncbi:MAG: hypothetical protein JW946_06135, partial [Candidatus Omnitrophica bacterium]|nr:hypothetical protein [Candidatus Omnitrophota bacterium]
GDDTIDITDEDSVKIRGVIDGGKLKPVHHEVAKWVEAIKLLEREIENAKETPRENRVLTLKEANSLFEALRFIRLPNFISVVLKNRIKIAKKKKQTSVDLDQVVRDIKDALDLGVENSIKHIIRERKVVEEGRVITGLKTFIFGATPLFLILFNWICSDCMPQALLNIVATYIANMPVIIISVFLLTLNLITLWKGYIVKIGKTRYFYWHLFWKAFYAPFYYLGLMASAVMVLKQVWNRQDTYWGITVRFSSLKFGNAVEKAYYQTQDGLKSTAGQARYAIKGTMREIYNYIKTRGRFHLILIVSFLVIVGYCFIWTANKNRVMEFRARTLIAPLERVLGEKLEPEIQSAVSSQASDEKAKTEKVKPSSETKSSKIQHHFRIYASHIASLLTGILSVSLAGFGTFTFFKGSSIFLPSVAVLIGIYIGMQSLWYMYLTVNGYRALKIWNDSLAENEKHAFYELINQPLAVRLKDGTIKYHPAYSYLSERAKLAVCVHEMFKHEFTGMVGMLLTNSLTGNVLERLRLFTTKKEKAVVEYLRNLIDTRPKGVTHLSDITDWKYIAKAMKDRKVGYETGEFKIVLDLASDGIRSFSLRLPADRYLKRDKEVEARFVKFLTFYIKNRMEAFGPQKIYFVNDNNISAITAEAIENFGKEPFKHTVGTMTEMHSTPDMPKEQKFRFIIANSADMKRFIAVEERKQAARTKEEKKHRINLKDLKNIDNVLVGLDIGGTDVKVILYNEKGEIIFYKKHNWDPEDITDNDRFGHLEVLEYLTKLALLKLKLEELKETSALNDAETNLLNRVDMLSDRDIRNITEESEKDMVEYCNERAPYQAMFSDKIINGVPVISVVGVVTEGEKLLGKLPKPEGIGISWPGLIIDGTVRDKAKCKGLSNGAFDRNIRPLAANLADRIGIDRNKVAIINDGDVLAFWASVMSGHGNILAIALGTAIAGGYTPISGIPKNFRTYFSRSIIDMTDPDNIGYKAKFGPEGIAAEYISQQGILRLSRSIGIDFSLIDKLVSEAKKKNIQYNKLNDELRRISPILKIDILPVFKKLEQLKNVVPDVDYNRFYIGDRAEQLKFIQALFKAGYKPVCDKVYEDMGLFLAVLIKELADYFDDEEAVKDVVTAGRCVKWERGGKEIVKNARAILGDEFNLQVASQIAGDPRMDEFSQAIGAAWLVNQKLQRLGGKGAASPKTAPATTHEPTSEVVARYKETIGENIDYSANDRFNHPRAVTFDAEGNFYVADTDNNRIQKFSKDGA